MGRSPGSSSAARRAGHASRRTGPSSPDAHRRRAGSHRWGRAPDRRSRCGSGTARSRRTGRAAERLDRAATPSPPALDRARPGPRTRRRGRRPSPRGRCGRAAVRRGRSGGDGSDAVASGGRASPVMGSDAARSRQGPRHRHRRWARRSSAASVSSTSSSRAPSAASSPASSSSAVVVDPVADVRPRLIDRAGHPGRAERAPRRALRICRRLVAHPAPTMSQDHAPRPRSR